MRNLRTYGRPPLGIAVIHGGPGAGGEMAPVARELQADWGVLEPLQTKTTLERHVSELKAVLETSANLPAVLIGFSWGAWLSFIVAARYPSLVQKLVLVGSGPFEHKYLRDIGVTRLSRLSENERGEYESIIRKLGGPYTEGKASAFARLGALASKTDEYDPIDPEPDEPDVNGGQSNEFHAVLKEGQEMRKTGKLLDLGNRIQCPIVAIHGDYDPHPAEGVRGPLSAVLKSFRFVLLENCGHKPWIERQARGKFYATLRAELRSGSSDDQTD